MTRRTVIGLAAGLMATAAAGVGAIGPKGLPADRVAFLEKALRQAAQTPKFREALVVRGEAAVGSTGAEFRKAIATEFVEHGEIIQALGLKKK